MLEIISSLVIVFRLFLPDDDDLYLCLFLATATNAVHDNAEKVDEISYQSLDAEGHVHKRLLKVTSARSRGQSFLLSEDVVLHGLAWVKYEAGQTRPRVGTG